MELKTFNPEVFGNIFFCEDEYSACFYLKLNWVLSPKCRLFKDQYGKMTTLNRESILTYADKCNLCKEHLNRNQ